MSSSKKFTRSGKKGSDDNAGNFVFSFPGSNPPSPSLNYGGSVPSSPLGSPTTAFGTINSGSPAFPTFGAAPSSPSASNVFVFGNGTSATPASPNLGMRRTATDLAPNSPTVEVSDFRRTNSDISNPSSTFTFGSTSTTTTPGSSTGTGSSGFTFGAKPQPINPTSTNTSTASAPSSPAAPSTGTSPFSFGSSANTTAAKPAPTPFSFGTTPTSGTATPPPTGFSFNPPTQNTSSTASSGTTSTPSFGSPAAPTTTSSTASPFSFGGSSVASFGSPSTQKADTTTPSNTTGTTSPFSFKTPASSNTTAPATSSGGSLSSTPTSSTIPTLSFGTSTPTTTNASSKPAATVEKKDDATKKADTPATSTPSIFSFGSTTPSSTSTTSTTLPSFSAKPATATTTTTTTTTTAIPTPAVPSGPNPFSFATILQDLEKTATQPPNQIGAALVTPSLNALRQNQVVTHTNFRIDNILPSTRYTELPEQARKELDELDRYIHGESQRCDYIVKHAAPKRQESMKDAQHEQEIMASKLNSICSSLQIQVNATEELFDSLKEQIRHFSDGQSVIESCKNPGDRSARWLFGYGVDDDYFVNLSGRLATRLEEYKKCIREIEFTTESWTKNRAQSPQDIARIMESQNQTFLAMTNKVAALHEKLTMEQDLYTQYRLQAITL